MAVLAPAPKKKKARAARLPAYTPVVAPHFTPQAFPSNSPLPGRLARKLADLRSKVRLVRGAERVAQGLAAAVMLLTAQMFIDWLVDLPFLVRLLILAGDIALLVFFLRKYLLPHLLRPLNQEACALMVEKHWPKFRGRVIAAVQFAGPRLTVDSPELIRALQQEAEARTIALNFGDIVPTRPLKRRAAAAVILGALLACGMVVTAPGSLALLERVFLLPAKVPRKTEVICISGDKVIPAGDSVVLEAQAKGIIPSHGRVTLVDGSGRIQEITLDPERDQPDYFSLKIDSVEQPLTYTIRLNDGSSGAYHVKTVPRPDVTTIDCEQIYPKYTGLDPVKRTVGNLALLAGSRLQIHAIANGRLTKASLKLIGLNKVLPLTIGGADANDLKGEIAIPAAGLTGFSIELTNQAGITSGDETQYQIDLIPDRAPTAQLIKPERLQELYTLKAKPAIVYQAGDDYGLAQVDLCYRIIPDEDTAPVLDANGNPPPPPPPKRIPMDLGKTRPLLNLQQTFNWDLAAIKPPVTEGTSLEYWIEARDGNDVTGPGIGESEHHVIKVVSEMEKKAEVMSDLMDDLSRIKDASEREVDINKNLERDIEGKPAPNNSEQK